MPLAPLSDHFFKDLILLREVLGYPESVADMKVPGDVQDEWV